MKIVNTFSQHLGTREISLESGLKRKQLDLASEIHGAKKVYLDTKSWILLRDSRLGTNSSDSLAELFRLLETGVANGRFVCPVSADTFIELFQQANPVTLRATALTA